MKKGMIELIAPDDDKTKLYYYELKEKCLEIVSQYQKLGEQQKNQFERFARFIPSGFSKESEFVLFEMGYKIKKPLLNEKSYGVPCGKKLYIKRSLKAKAEEDYLLSLSSNSLLCLNLAKVDQAFPTGFIDRDGNVISFQHKTDFNASPHQILSRTLLHHYLMESKENCELYLDYVLENGKNINTEYCFMLIINSLLPYAACDPEDELPLTLMEELQYYYCKLTTQYEFLPKRNSQIITTNQEKVFYKIRKERNK